MARSRRSNVNTAKRQGFTKLLKGGPPAHRETVRRAAQKVAIVKRQKRAFSLLLRGLTFDEIGKQLKVSNFTAWHDCVAYRDALVTHGLLDVEMLRAEQQVILNKLKATHLRTRHKESSSKVLISALEREARLNGLDKRQTGIPADQVMAMAVGLARDLLEIITDLTQRRAIMRAIQKRMGVAATQAIDVTPAAEKESAS